MRLTFDRLDWIRSRARELQPKPPRVPRAYRKVEGRCGCGRIPADGRSKCEGCRAWSVAARAKRIAEGVCAHARSHGPAVTGGKHCARCREFYRAQTAAAKAKKRSEA